MSRRRGGILSAVAAVSLHAAPHSLSATISTMQGRGPPLILTLKLDREAQAYFDALRREHFPAKLNFLQAHLTLFHALPSEHLPRITQCLRQATARGPLALKAGTPRSLGRGVAVSIESRELVQLRESLAKEFAVWLTRQDAQAFRPHVTVQNKVTPAQSRALLNQLVETLVPFEIIGEALQLWRYAGGPWEAEALFTFGT